MTSRSQLEERLRRDAREILAAGVAGADPRALVHRALHGEPHVGPPITLVAVGKAAGGMAGGVADSPLVSRVTRALVVTPHGLSAQPKLPQAWGWLTAGHPIPDSGSMAAARAVRTLAESGEVDEEEMGGGSSKEFLMLLSGGASALLTLPVPGLTLSHLQATTRILQEAGATIHQLNAVRTSLDVLKGGGLAALVRAQTIRGLLLSDVVGDDPVIIGSGPLCAGAHGGLTAWATIQELGVEERVPQAVRRYLAAGLPGGADGESGGGDGHWGRSWSHPDGNLPPVSLTVVGSVANAVGGARKRAEMLGYSTQVKGLGVEGESREVGRALGREALALLKDKAPREPTCVLMGGETTVTVRGRGVGGRNQEVALGAALELEGGGVGALVASMGTDGVDGPTPAAGGMVTWTSAARARAQGRGVEHALDSNDSYPCLRALGDLLVTGPTGTNVMDLMLVLAWPGA
ncbi:MAG: DUF4147 domain-containing protein [Gemmatimonadota bacterium]